MDKITTKYIFDPRSMEKDGFIYKSNDHMKNGMRSIVTYSQAYLVGLHKKRRREGG